jgi:hypothetical protein
VSSLRQWQEYGYGPWAAVDKETGQWIGRVGLDELPDWPDEDRVEVGFELSPVWWGRGLATEATIAALRFGFDEVGLRRIISTTARDHVVARRVMEKAGLTTHTAGNSDGTMSMSSGTPLIATTGLSSRIGSEHQGEGSGPPPNRSRRSSPVLAGKRR